MESPNARVDNGQSSLELNMKAETIDAVILVQEDDRGLAGSTEASACDSWSYARQLRALGQAVEKFRLSEFDIEHKGGSYHVVGRAAPVAKPMGPLSCLVRALLCASYRSPEDTNAADRVVLRFSPEDIERFDLRGKNCRQDCGQMPDPYHISQILRGAGTYLDHKNVADLIGISFSGQWIAMSYQTAAGHLDEVRENLQCYYDFWVKLYLHRSNRPKAPPPSDPTFNVTWKGMRRA
jgi:hypothetical protein